MTDARIPLLYTPEEGAASLGIRKTKIYELMGTREIESVKIGRCRRIPADALAEYVERLRQESRVGA